MIVDASERHAALDPAHSFIVQAPAGSGKTGLLIQRFLVLLAYVNEPEEILAITFTRKAAAEMAERILEALTLVRNQSRPSESGYEQALWDIAHAALLRSQEKNWQLETYPARLKIYTIDAFCRSLTRRMPFSSGLGLTATPSEDPEVLYSEAINQVFEVLKTPEENYTDLYEFNCQQALQHVLPILDNNLSQLQNLLIEMLKKRDQWMRHVYVLFQFIQKHLHAQSANEQQEIQADLDNVRAQFESSLQKTIQEKIQAVHAGFLQACSQQEIDNLVLLCQTVANKQTDKNALEVFKTYQANQVVTGEIAFCAIWQGLANLFLTKSRQWRTRFTKTDGFAAKTLEHQSISEYSARLRAIPHLETLLVELSDYLPDKTYDLEDWETLKHLIFLLVYAVAKLKQTFTKMGEVDFSEITQAALNVFGDEEYGTDCPSDLALRLDYQIRHILFDEFQDTSYVQYALLQKLTRGWQKGEGRTVFIVGDPMQSIYSFREANVSLFLRAKQAGAIQPDLILTNIVLQQNFRSTLPLIEWFNRNMKEILPKYEEVETGAIPYTPSVSTKDFDYSPDFYQAVTHHAFSEENEEVYSDVEAQRIVEIIRKTQKHYSLQKTDHTIAVLVYNRQHAAHLITVLQQEKIAYLPVKIERLSQAPVIQDLLALTRALMHPADRVAWLALLRAPFMGLDLKEFSVLFAHQESYDCTVLERLAFFIEQQDDLNQALRAQSHARLVIFLDIMRRALTQRQKLHFADLVQGVWLSLNAPAYLTEIERKATLDYFQLLKQVLSKSGYYFPELSVLLKELDNHYVDAKVYDQNPVQIMTIHQSKGLEFGTVILPSLHRKRPPPQKELLKWLESDPLTLQSGLLLAPLSVDEDAENKTYCYIKHIQAQRLQYEMQRLLYVALTRAACHLHLLANFYKEPKGEILLAHLLSSKEIRTAFECASNLSE